MKVGSVVKDIEFDKGAIGIIIEIKHGIGIYVVRFHGEERWLIGSELEVICEGR